MKGVTWRFVVQAAKAVLVGVSGVAVDQGVLSGKLAAVIAALLSAL